MRLSGQRNQCPSCGELFNSNAAFDKHRTGQFGKDRRCMSVDEMLAHGMAKNAAGWWVTALNPMFAEDAAEYSTPNSTPLAGAPCSQRAGSFLEMAYERDQ